MKIYLVGGAVRDQLLNLPVKEKDYVVVGADTAEMLALGYRQVGKDFPVFLHPETNEEYALARIERKEKPGYKGFSFDASKTVTLAEDLQRRDLTINAIAQDPKTKEIIDPYHGQNDLKSKTLRHVSQAFVEDPVRILRIGRFLARFAHLGFKVANETLALMQTMVKNGEVDALVAERVWKELERALAEKNPEKFFELLDAANALSKLFPNIKLTGLGVSNLRFATLARAKTIVRFAVLFAHLPEDKEDKTDCRFFINNICNRYKVPNAYRELALLTAHNFSCALKAKNLSADKLLTLFNRLDIFRREARYYDFISATQAIAQTKNMEFDADWLIRCAQVAKSFDVHELLSQGYTSQQLPFAIKEKRIEKIDHWLQDQK